MAKGVDAWFQHLNETQGGITSADGKTREIEWTYLDDQYSPPKTLENVRLLVEQEKVWAVLNPLGTPSNTAIRDYMNQAKVPQLFVATGASKWGREIEQYPYTIGYQPDYESEGIAYAQYILEQNPDAKIGILYANDDFGKDYLAGVKEGLGDKVDQLISEVTYETSDATIDNQVSQVKDSGADAFILIATPQFAIQGIQRVAALGWEPIEDPDVGVVVRRRRRPAGRARAGDRLGVGHLHQGSDRPEVRRTIRRSSSTRRSWPTTTPAPTPTTGSTCTACRSAQTFQHLLESMDNVCRDSIMAAVKDFSGRSRRCSSPASASRPAPGDGFPIQQVQMMQWNGDQLGVHRRGGRRRQRRLTTS